MIDGHKKIFNGEQHLVQKPFYFSQKTLDS